MCHGPVSPTCLIITFSYTSFCLVICLSLLALSTNDPSISRSMLHFYSVCLLPSSLLSAPSLGNSYLSFKIPPKYHFLWEAFFVSQTELRDPPPCPDSCLCISTPAPPMLYTKYVEWICLLTAETSLKLESVFSSFYSQQLTWPLARGNCSVSVCWVNRWVDGWVDEWRDAQAPCDILFPSIPLLHPSPSFLPKAMNTHSLCPLKATLWLKSRAARGSYDHFFHALVWTIKYSLRISLSRASHTQGISLSNIFTLPELCIFNQPTQKLKNAPCSCLNSARFPYTALERQTCPCHMWMVFHFFFF